MNRLAFYFMFIAENYDEIIKTETSAHNMCFDHITIKPTNTLHKTSNDRTEFHFFLNIFLFFYLQSFIEIEIFIGTIHSTHTITYDCK